MAKLVAWPFFIIGKICIKSYYVIHRKLVVIKFILLDFYNVLYFASDDRLNTDIFDFVQKNNKKYGFGVLSSVHSDLAVWFKDRKLDENFMFVKTTAELGVPKTEPGVYEMVVNGLETKPQEVLLIDDSVENLVAADEAGLKTLKYIRSKPFNKQISKHIKT